MATAAEQRDILTGSGTFTPENKHGQCESCGMSLSRGFYRLPSLTRRYCSIRCMELDLASRSRCHWCFAKGEPSGTKRRYCDDACRKRAEGTSFGDGVRLLNFLQRTRPDLCVPITDTHDALCAGCRTRLAGKKDGTRWCSDTCRKRHSHNSRKTQVGGKKPETCIEKTPFNSLRMASRHFRYIPTYSGGKQSLIAK